MQHVPSWAVVALSSVLTLMVSTAARAQSAWTGANSTAQWTDPSNWSAGVPGSTTTALFNGAGNGQTQITLGGTTQSLGAIQFDTSSAASYTLGTAAGDTFTLSNNNGTAGAVSVTSTVAAPQGINASVSFTFSSPLVSDAAATTLTFGAVGTSATINTASSLTLNTAPGATIVLNSALTGAAGGSFSNGSANGGVILAQTVNSSSPGSVIQFNSPNGTVTGIINLGNGNNTNGGLVLQIGASTDTSSPATYTKGPLGTATLVSNTTATNPVEAINGNQTIANPLDLVTGLTIQNAPTAFNLTFAGPITFTPNASRTFTFNTPNQTVTLGSASSPSTLTLSANSAGNNLALVTSTSSTLVINDVIQNSGSFTNTISFGNVNNNSGTVLITGANTFSGAATLTAQTGNTSALTMEIGVSSVAVAGSVTSGPFGTGSLLVGASGAATNLPLVPILEPFGADRTVANPITMNTGFFVANPSSALDPTGLHNLILTGAISDLGRVLTNNLGAGVALTLGSAGNPSTLSLTGAAIIQSQVTGAGGVTVINDVISGGTNTLTLKNGGTVYVNNLNNTYTGGTSVTGTGTLASGATLAGVGAVGSGGTVTISSLTAASQGGIIAPGNGTTPGTILVPSMTLDPLGRYVFQYNGTNNATGGGVNSLISGTGSLSLSNLSSLSAFDLNLVPVPGSGVSATPLSYVIATFTNGISTSGDVTSDFTFSGSFGSATPPTVTASGNNLVLTFTPVPEPNGVALAGGAVATLLLRRGRRPARAGELTHPQ